MRGKDSPSGEMNNSATVRMKYKPIIIHGVTRMALISAALIVLNASLAGKVNENIIRNTYASAAIPIPMAIFIGVDGSLSFFFNAPNSHMINGVRNTTKNGFTHWKISAPLMRVKPRSISITLKST